MNTFCSYFNNDICKSCKLIEIPYADQILKKEESLLQSLKPYNHPELLKTARSKIQHFRNKVKLVVTGTVESPIIGLWGEKNLDHGRELMDCSLHFKELNEILPKLRQFIIDAKIPPYQISTKKGEIKGVILFYSEITKEIYIRLILRSKESYERIKKQYPILLQSHPLVTCFSINIQPIPHAILEGQEEIFISENLSVHHKVGPFDFSLDPRSFVQTNQEVARQLYETCGQWVSFIKPDRFLELFCGQGIFSLYSANYIQEGLGIEINSRAVEGARKAAKNLNIKNLSFKCADAENIKDEMIKFDPTLLLVNPPRRGLGNSLQVILLQKPKVIIYSSCNHLTLISDLEQLYNHYAISKIQIFDMFPHTDHFETLVQLDLKTSTYDLVV